jgi:hypothetical protein
MTNAEQFQQQRLTVHFVHRFVDNELLAAGGDPRQIFVNAFSLSAACGLTLALLLALRYIFRINELVLPLRELAVAGDRQLLILLTATLTGLFTVLAWDSLLPDRKDANVLGPLPVAPRVVLRAKLLAALLYFAILQAAFQFLLLAFPLVSHTGPTAGLPRSVALQCAVLWAVALFVFFGAMAVQGVLALLLPYRHFLTASAFAQLFWLLASLSVTFFIPPVELAARAGAWPRWIPTSWFLDAWQIASGRPPVYGGTTPALPFLLTAAVTALALLAFGAGFGLVLRRVVEGGSVRRQGPARLTRAASGLIRRFLLREPREEACFFFAARTLLRHRNTRLMLTIYGGLALCWTLLTLSEALRPGRSLLSQPSALLLSIPLDFSFLLLLGMRVMFALPAELPANWIFRVLDRDGEEFYLRGARKLLFLAGCLPLALLLAPGYLFLWGPGIALRHTLLVLLAGWLMTEMMMKDFRKVPFACSWAPGKANLKVTLGAWVLLFTSLSWMAGALEAAAVRSATGTLTMAAALLLPIGWLAARRRRAHAPGLLWEESQPGLELLQLDH